MSKLTSEQVQVWNTIYTATRAEILQHQSHRSRALQAYIVAVAAVITFSLKANAEQLHTVGWVLLVLPMVGLGATLTYLQHNRMIGRLSRFNSRELGGALLGGPFPLLPWEASSSAVEAAPVEAMPTEGGRLRRAITLLISIFRSSPGTWGTWLLIMGAQVVTLAVADKVRNIDWLSWSADSVIAGFDVVVIGISVVALANELRWRDTAWREAGETRRELLAIADAS